MHQPLLAHHGRVAAVAVGVQRPGEPCEQAFGDIACAGRVILEQHDGRLGAGAHLCPELGLRLRCLAGLFEDLHGGLVHQQVGPFDEFVAQHVDERHHELETGIFLGRVVGDGGGSYRTPQRAVAELCEEIRRRSNPELVDGLRKELHEFYESVK